MEGKIEREGVRREREKQTAIFLDYRDVVSSPSRANRVSQPYLPFFVVLPLTQTKFVVDGLSPLPDGAIARIC